MDQRLQATTGREYVDFEPKTTTIQEVDHEILLVHLPGFQKEQLKINLNPDWTLSVTGEHQVENNKWSRVQTKYPLSASCDTSRIEAKFETDTLRITLHKLTRKKPTSDAPLAQGTTSMPSTDPPPKQRNNEADAPGKQPKTKKKTGKPTRDEPQKPDSVASMFLVALLVLVLGFFASNWFGTSGK